MNKIIRPGPPGDTGAAPASTPVRPRLDAGPTGTVIHPDDPGWDRARAAWISNVDQQPAAVAVVRSVDDVCAVVASAAGQRLRVMAQSTGHGAMAVPPLTETVLVRTAGMSEVRIDPSTRTAWCGAGAEWRAVTEAAAEHGLAAQAGSAADVGVTGFVLSGGISWLSRLHGLAVNDVVQLEVVTADGAPHRVDLDHEPELFWALRGGGGSFGVVTGVGLRLHPLATVTAGSLFFPMTRAGEVLQAWREWRQEPVPNATMSCGRLLQLPPLPELPPPLRGQAFAVVEFAHQGPAAELAAAIEPFRQLGPVMDTVSEIPTAGLAGLHMDPPGPTPCRSNGLVLRDLPVEAVDALLGCAGPGSGSPLLSVELRQLGGAVAQRPPQAGAVGHLEGAALMYAVGFTPDRATAAQVETHVELVERTLHPWAAEVQYANLDERAAGGQTRFHDRATLERLYAIKGRTDPGGLFTSGHPLMNGS